MKTKIFLVVIFAVFAVIPTQLFAQTSTTADARLFEPITLNKTAELHFGAMTSPTSDATCVLSTTGARTVGAAITLINSTSFPVSAATFSVSGALNATYAITISTATITVSDGAGHSMDIDNLLVKSANVVGDQAAGYNGKLGTGGGTDIFSIGGTLHVNANQTAAAYSATFDVSVAYN